MTRGWTRAFVRALLPRDSADAILADLERERSRRSARGARLPDALWLAAVGIQLALRLRIARLIDSIHGWTGGGLAGVGSDIRHAVRAIRRNPGVLVMATTVLALGIAAPTTMYSLGRGLTRDLPVPEPGRLVHIGYTSVIRSPQVSDLRGAELASVRARGGLAATMAAYADAPVDIASAERPPERVPGARVTSNLFDVLRTPPVRGRDFTNTDARPGAQPVALIGERLWMHRYGGDPAAVGATLRVDGSPYTVVGVVPDRVRFPSAAQVWIPIALDGLDSTDARTPFGGIARLPDGARIDRIVAELGGIVLPQREARAGMLDRETPRLVVRPYRDELFSGFARDALSAMLALMGCILFVACANVANLLLARAVYRQRETAVRIALGAGKARILVHYLAEAAVVSAVGGALALGLTRAALTLFDRAAIGELAWWMEFHLDVGTMVFATVLSVLAALAAGTAPALQLIGRDVGALRGGVRSGSDFRIARISQTLVLVEVTLSAIALTVGALIVHEMSSYFSTRNAFDLETAPVLVGQYDVSADRGADPVARRAFHRRLLGELAAQPGVASAALSQSVSGFPQPELPFQIEGVPEASVPKETKAQLVMISPGYFDVIGAPLLRGRDLTWSDGDDEPPAVLVNDRFSAVLLGGRDPIGLQVRVGRPLVPERMLATIVGIVPTLGEDQPNRNGVALYLPIVVSAPRTAFMLARPEPGRDPTTQLEPMRAALRSLDPERPVYSVLPLSELFKRARWSARFLRGFFVVFGLAGLLMAGTGLYGVISFAVARRTQEVGIRVALGAGPLRVALAVVRGFAGRVVAGGTCGLILVRLGAPGFGANLGLRHPSDPVPYVFVAVLLTLTAAGAVAIPLRRALAVQPMEALRVD